MKISNNFKILGTSLIISALPILKTPVFAQDYKCKTDSFEYRIPPKGTDDFDILKDAPDPYIKIDGTWKNAKIVVNLEKNILYKYDEYGFAEKAFLIASGKSTTPTSKGVRIVTHIEKYPYKTAPARTKRRRNPSAYGPNIICLNKINPTTGEQSQTGEFIHGNNDQESIGKYVSNGCMRMDNEVIQDLIKEVKRGDIVIIK